MADLTQYSTDELFTQLKRMKNDPSSKCQSGKTAYKKAASEKMDAIGIALIRHLQNKKALAVYTACV